jgi:hypothetical protein
MNPYDASYAITFIYSVLSELIRNVLWLNYLEMSSQFAFYSTSSLGLSEPKVVLCRIENCAIGDPLAAHMA